MTENEARAVLEQALKMSQAENAEVTVVSTGEGSTRFSNNSITQNIAKTDVTLTVRSAYGQRVGTARINQLDAGHVAAVVRKSEEIARVSEPNTEYMGPVDPCPIAHVESWDDATACATPDDRATVVHAGLVPVEAAGLNAAGSYATEQFAVGIANSHGHFAFHRGTEARFQLTALTPDSTGWAEGRHWSTAQVDGKDAGERAVAKALAAVHPQAVEPKPYTVIMEPAAVAEMMAFFAWSLDAKAADEGRSAFSGKLGKQVGTDLVTIMSSPEYPGCPSVPFADDGMPMGEVRWVDVGRMANLVHTRFWAQKAGRAYTGMPRNMVIEGGTKSTEEMVASTDEGILITRFWYIRFVDPMKLLLTGMTRDGLFRISGGQIVGGLKNMRFNDSPLRLLQHVTDVGKPQLTGYAGPALVPPIKMEGFVFSSGTAF